MLGLLLLARLWTLPALAEATPPTRAVDPDLRAALEAQLGRLAACSPLAAAIPEERRIIGIVILELDPSGPLTARSLPLREMLPPPDPQIRLLESCVQEQAASFRFPAGSRTERVWLVAAVSFLDPGGSPSLVHAHLQDDPDVVGVGIGGYGTADGLGPRPSPQAAADAQAELVGAPIIEGALERAQIDAVLKRYTNQLRYCYQRELVKTPDLGGAWITLRLTVEPDGTIASAEAAPSTPAYAAVAECIEGRLTRIQFLAPPDGRPVAITYTLAFTPPSAP